MSIAVILCGAMQHAMCVAAPLELPRSVAAWLPQSLYATGSAGLLGGAPTEKSVRPGTLAAARAPTAMAGPVALPMAIPAAGRSAQLSPATDPAAGIAAIHGIAHAWGPPAAVGRMPAAHVDLWKTSRTRVALAAHHGLSLQGRVAF
jgi:hypothetical protein